MATLIDQAVMPALTRLEFNYLMIPDSSALVVPIASPVPAAAFLITIESDDESLEVLMHLQLCIVPPARRPQVALHLADLNTRYRFVTFSMTDAGEVRVDVGVQLLGVVAQMQSTLVEVGFKRLLHAFWHSGDEVLQTALTRKRQRSRVEREVNQVLRNIDP